MMVCFTAVILSSGLEWIERFVFLHASNALLSFWSWAASILVQSLEMKELRIWIFLFCIWLNFFPQLQLYQGSNLYIVCWQCLGRSCLAFGCWGKRQSCCLALINYNDKTGLHGFFDIFLAHFLTIFFTSLWTVILMNLPHTLSLHA